jgi:hypothetical protein
VKIRDESSESVFVTIAVELFRQTPQ